MAMSSYKVTVIAIVAILAVGTGSPPSARSRQAAHDIQWYATHHAERHAMLARCRSDMAFSRNIECLNAEAGGNIDYKNRLNARVGSRI